MSGVGACLLPCAVLLWCESAGCRALPRRQRNAEGYTRRDLPVGSSLEPVPEAEIADEVGGGAPEDPEERHVMGALLPGLFPVDLAHDPDGRPHGPLANHTPEGDWLPASALDATAQIDMIRERGEASAQNPDAFEAKPVLAWHRGGQEGPRFDGHAEALLALQDALPEDGFHEQPR